ncbi:MAG: hypothetical protein ACRCU2_14855 [Planktothrix sp.]
MSIKLKAQESIENKLSSLIKQADELAQEFLKQEYEENYAEFSAAAYGQDNFDDPEEMLEPSQYSDSIYKLKKWQKQCLNLLSKLPLKNTVYSDALELLSGKKDKKGREIYLSGIDIQEIGFNLEAILEELKDGMFNNIFLAIEVQLVLNHIEQAKKMLDNNQHILAGLMALGSLESLLTELCRENLGDQEMPTGLQEKSDSLKNEGIIDSSTHQIINQLAKTQNDMSQGDSKLVSKDQAREVMIEVKFLVRSLMPND